MGLLLAAHFKYSCVVDCARYPPPFPSESFIKDVSKMFLVFGPPLSTLWPDPLLCLLLSQPPPPSERTSFMYGLFPSLSSLYGVDPLSARRSCLSSLFPSFLPEVCRKLEERSAFIRGGLSKGKGGGGGGERTSDIGERGFRLVKKQL